MHRLLQTVVFGFALMVACPVQAFSEIPPEDYLLFAVKSLRVVLIDVDSVKIGSARSAKGIEVRDVVVEGKRIETIRGNDAGARFRNQIQECRVSDPEEAERSFPEGAMDSLLSEQPHRGSLCKKGRHYLVIFLDNETIYFEVSKTDDGWRKKMLKIQKRWNEQVEKR